MSTDEPGPIPAFADPFHPTRQEILAHVAYRNAQGIAPRFSMGELIEEAKAAERDGHLEWRDGGRWITAAGRDLLLSPLEA